MLKLSKPTGKNAFWSSARLLGMALTVFGASVLAPVASGPHAFAQDAAHPQPVFMKQTPRHVFPRVGAPSPRMYLFDARRLDARTKALVASAQGLANRKNAQLYAYFGGNRIQSLVEGAANEAANQDNRRGGRPTVDQAWLEWLVAGDYFNAPQSIESVEQLLTQFQLKNCVVVDPDFPASVNIATMIASLRNAVIAYPEHVEQYNLRVVDDLRGRWTKNLDAYEWAFDNLWPQMNQTAIASQSPQILPNLRDYLVAKKIFTFWISDPDLKNGFETPQDLARWEAMLKKLPVNVPILGYASTGGADHGIGEGRGVLLFSNHGKFLVPTDWHTNLSVWTGLEAKNKRPQQPAPRKLQLDDEKMYVCLLISDGDNMNMWLDFVPTGRYWNSPVRGQLPLAWSIGPGILDLQAPLIDYYYGSQTAMDSFGCAVSGIGYMYPHDYGSAFGKAAQRKILDGYIDTTQRYMKQMDLDWIWTTIIGARNGENLHKYTKAIDGCSIVFEGYGRQWWRDEPYMVNGVPVFHFVNDAVDPEQTLAEALRHMPKTRPGFATVFIQNWPFTLDSVKELSEQLGDDVVIVRPEELAELYKQHASEASQ